MAALPYITAPGNIDKAFNAIKSAATPERVSQDFVKTILKITGGSGDQVTAFLRKIGFVNTDGSPSDLYKSFRNGDTAGAAAAKALKIAYKPLYIRNEYMHQLSDEKLRGLIVEETGQSNDSTVVGLIISSIKAIKKHANSSEGSSHESTAETKIAHRTLPENKNGEDVQQFRQQYSKVGLNLSYTINLNLPASSDIAVFNAIFKSLKENLLTESDG